MRSLLAILLLASVSALAQPRPDKSPTAANTATLDSILRFLPEDTNTLVVSQHPFRIEATDLMDVNDIAIESAIAESARHLIYAGLRGVAGGILPARLAGKTMSLSVFASRAIAPALHDQSADSDQACAFHVAQEPYLEDTLSIGPDQAIFGRRTWKSIGAGWKTMRDPATLYMTLLQADVLLVCNSRKFLEDIVSRPPGSENSNRAALVWLFCRMPRFEGLEKVPSSVGPLSVEFDSNPASIRARVRSDANPWRIVLATPDSGVKDISRQLDKSTWELRVDKFQEPDVVWFLTILEATGFEPPL